MSLQAMAWAMDQQVITDPVSRHVLLVMANSASETGRNTFKSISTLAHLTGLTDRTVQKKISDLLALGVLQIGSQVIVEDYGIPADRRPKNYHIVMSGVPAAPKPVRRRGVPDAPRLEEEARGASDDSHGVNVRQERGVLRSPNTNIIPTEKTNTTPVVPKGTVDVVDPLPLAKQRDQRAASGKRARASDDPSATFLAFWRVYSGNKGCGRKQAWATWLKTAGGASEAAVMAAVERDNALWKREGRELSKRPHATTWLNRERWNDEPEPEREFTTGNEGMDTLLDTAAEMRARIDGGKLLYGTRIAGPAHILKKLEAKR